LRISPSDWDHLPSELQVLLAPLRGDEASLSLGVSEEGPWLGFDDEPSWKPLVLNFEEGRLGYRAARVEQSSEQLKKALGPRRPLRILDATAGLGRDSLILALLGHSVISYEKSPALFALTWLARARMEVPASWEVRFGDAAVSTEKADIVYLDPMYPDEGRTAASRKDLQAVRKVATPTDEIDERKLWQWARTAALARVVVKRPRHGRDLVGAPEPTHRLEGKSTRFDVYLVS